MDVHPLSLRAEVSVFSMSCLPNVAEIARVKKLGVALRMDPLSHSGLRRWREER